MKSLITLYRAKNINITGKTFVREAVRGIVLRPLTPVLSPKIWRGESGKELLMIYSPVNGDYKFPGGGVNAGESHEEALYREIREECGATLTQVTGELGEVISYARAMQAGFETFKMVSHYYFCAIDGNLGEQDLDDYEAELAYHPVWIKAAAALKKNKSILAASNPNLWWIRREVFVLELLEKLKND